MTKLHLNVAAAALMAGLIALPAQALDVSVGGTSDGGVSASASEGSTSANAKIGGGGGNVANARILSGGNNATVRIGSGSGSLLSATSSGSPTGGTSNTDAAVNLGGILGGGIPGVGGGGGGGGPTPGDVAAAVNAAGGDIGQLKLTCGAVLGSPGRYEAQLVRLCRVLSSL